MLGTAMVSLTLALATTAAGGPFDGHGRFSVLAANQPQRPLPRAGAGQRLGLSQRQPRRLRLVRLRHGDPDGPDRTSEYFFPRYYAAPANQMFSPQFYNGYFTRGQRYMPYANCGGEHPMGGLPQSTAPLPRHPYDDTIGTGPRVTVPTYRGRVEAAPVNVGTTGLTP